MASTLHISQKVGKGASSASHVSDDHFSQAATIVGSLLRRFVQYSTDSMAFSLSATRTQR